MNSNDQIVLFIFYIYFLANMYLVGVFHDRLLQWKILLFFFGIPLGIGLTLYNVLEKHAYSSKFINSTYYIYFWLKSYITPQHYKNINVNWEHAKKMLNKHPKPTGYGGFAVRLYINRLRKLQNKSE